MAQFLHALALQFYRGIGPVEQRMTGFQDFNFFIGANNAGKSIVLNFLYGRFNQGEKRNKFSGVENYRGQVSGQLMSSVGVPESEFLSAVLARLPEGKRFQLDFTLRELVRKISDSGLVWLKSDKNDFSRIEYAGEFEPTKWFSRDSWYSIWSTITGQGNGDINRDWIPETLRFLLSSQELRFPEILLIPAKREIGPTGGQFEDLSGRGLIDRLAEIQSPDHDSYDHDREQFSKINRFLESVTDRPDARIEIPHNRSSILVHMDNKVLPLASLGTGIHEVVMIAAFSTINQNCIMCIEEPEIHLHPILQRKLVRYLQKHTNNQYFIATHSAAFIDTPGAAIFHVNNDGDQTHIRGTNLRSDKYKVCLDLGYKASDILQSNAVVWVEGPSDRIYLNKWISQVDPSLIEGVHYSIMFYGGRLLSHLSGDPEGLEGFIQLRSLNRNSAIVIDSDKKHHRDEINETKKRLKNEFDKNSGFCWITKGREIENYVDHGVLQNAVKELNEGVYDQPSSGGQYDHALHFQRHNPKKRRKAKDLPDSLLEANIDKVAVAHRVSASTLSLEVLDLKERVSGLIAFIQNANLH